MENAVDLLARNTELAAFMCAGGDENRLVIVAKLLDGNVFSDETVINKFNAFSADNFYFVVEHLLGQPIFRDTPAKHTARLALRFINRNRKARVGKVARRGKSGRACADYGDFFRVSRRFLLFGQSQSGPLRAFPFLYPMRTV